jgi:hypothetical protein
MITYKRIIVINEKSRKNPVFENSLLFRTKILTNVLGISSTSSWLNFPYAYFLKYRLK